MRFLHGGCFYMAFFAWKGVFLTGRKLNKSYPIAIG